MSGPLALSALLLALFGTAHCAAMCGSFVAASWTPLAGDARRNRTPGLYAALPMHAGRLASYATAGALAGALGATPVEFPRQAECCGSTLVVSAPGANRRLSTAVVDSARLAGAAMIVTACPLCKYNLDQAQAGRPSPEQLPVAYFTQVMAAAFGLLEVAGPAFAVEAST